jgi:tRNA pseudouridine32 synthase / 23S rRNA pseudouridine746 synthase
MINSKYFRRFNQEIQDLPLPNKFTFPFYYEPHELSKIACEELQTYLETQTEWKHNFGLDETQTGLVIGKMFGVLVVQNNEDEVGYLAAYSGKLSESNHISFFVPPVFDLLQIDGFFKKEESELNELNRKIETLENSISLKSLNDELVFQKLNFEKETQNIKFQIKENKQKRDVIRLNLENQSLEFNDKLEILKKESIKEQYFLKDHLKKGREIISTIENKISILQQEINSLKEIRKKKSSKLQEKIFTEYAFYNRELEKKSLNEIFKDSFENKPPAGAGECAAPKLLQYAFQHNLKPISMAEFWWGTSPKSELRIHKNYYPACKGKCEPILSHMLEGIELEENKLISTFEKITEIPIVYEDEHLLLVNKPPDFLSVPGKSIKDSVESRMKINYPNATGPLLVHRLDMSTSGLILIAKTKEIHKHLQNQFIKRTVKKRYCALLDGKLSTNVGTIDLPLRLDIDDRPRQLVCFEHGKKAVTKFELIEYKNGKSKVYFYPLTGRTHQLRVHAAHLLGLNCPILGDDLYGNKSNRLYLHAEELEFFHPVTNDKMKIIAPCEF